MREQRIGIIDIGSNSIRLVIYERTTNGAHRVIEGSKRPARLSGEIDAGGNLSVHAIDNLVDILRHFRLICSHQHTYTIRAVATAAIRNAANRDDILNRLDKEAGLRVELLSGKEEAEFGFLGMINSMDIEDGFLVDIGGGSTEISLFRNRKLLRSVSFPFGCVNLARAFMDKGMMNDSSLQALELYVKEAFGQEPWIAENEGLPLVAVGGTARAFGKIHQAQHHYPFQQTHNYPIAKQSADSLFSALRSLPLDKRKKFPGLSKDRVDLIVPGLAVLRLILQGCKASEYIICGAGLRDGLFYTSRFTERPLLDDVLAYSVNNLCALHPEPPQQHISHVNVTAMMLFDTLSLRYPLPERSRSWMDAASMLFRIGASIDYYQYAKHSFYLIVNSHLNGLSHREILIVAAIASFRSKNKARQHLNDYKQLLESSDLELILRLGTLLQLAIALDRSEAQSLQRMRLEAVEDKLYIQPLLASDKLEVERKEVDALADDFNKVWGFIPVLQSI
ncbi:Ppx/GppA phosphatase family protein [Paenibacillus abyssi]|uniref:Exopolyphosphatase n=1 Tax=Paenibacillus abyssi TaxID=1340531 RepID=A0A917G437_9BACL|nr:Ppx/GppA phosphatase family protein [Paenibacillus abyssi]GGG20882.1 exopolyphosphatase [Paenibacillus abyssi]